MAPSAVLEEIRLPAFKSVRDATLPLRDLTLVVGRNGSGKSNLLEGLGVLSRLAGGGEIREQLDGGRDGPAIRGGVEGCAPLGTDRFTLGCTASTPDGRYHLDVTVLVRPVVQVVHERLVHEPSSPRATPRTLLESEPADHGSGELTARWDAGRRGRNPTVAFRASQLLTSQVATRVPATARAGRDVHHGAAAVLDALAGVFLLDPDPAAMRRYVPAGDDRLRRRAENLAAVLGRLLDDPAAHDRLLGTVRALSESQVVALTTERSTLGDLVLVQRELVGGQEATIPARLLSDGTLRVLAILAALDEADPRTADAPDGGRSNLDRPATTLVLEEVEQGLHPSQAAAMVARIVEAASSPGLRVLASTHGPAVLDALPGDAHEGVVACVRDDQGWTRLHRLTELPSYFTVVAGGTLGTAATRDRLRPTGGGPSASELVDELFGGP